MAALDAQSTAVGAFNEVLKIDYEKGIIDSLNDEQPLLSKIKGDSESWTGQLVQFPARVSRNQSAAATTEGYKYHTPGKQTYKDWQIPAKYAHGSIRLTAQVMAASMKSKGAFARALGSEIDGLVEDMANYRGRAIWGWGNGVLCLVNGDPGTGTTITVDAPHGVAGSVNGSRFIQPGMFIAFINPSDGAIRAGGARTVDAVAATGLTFTITAAADAAVADNDYIVAAMESTTSDVNETTYAKEIMGMLGLVDSTTYVSTLHNIDRSASPGNFMQSTVISSVGALSADVLQRAIDTVHQKARGKTDAIWCEHATRRAYQVMLENDRRYMAASLMNPDAGTKAAKQKSLDFGGIPIEVDKDAPYGTMFGLEYDTFTRWLLTEGEWADDTGSILRFVSQMDAYEAVYRIFDNFGCEAPQRNWTLRGITNNIVVVHLP
ncbi:MAG: 2,3-dihydro-2,3-dihydroxybenzoate dehydrogenase [Nitrospira sp.]|jgi:hypothetical protein|nr:2,3-dihydro-2,3-dihydroxybenzoate dehydrogenase [Nitrospira sp.]